MSAALRHAVERAAHEPDFLANDLYRLASMGGADRETLASYLQFDVARYNELALCRTPRRDEHFHADVDAIARLVGANRWRLGNLVRLVDCLSALSMAKPSMVAPVLAAARQEDEPFTRPELRGRGLQPKWLLDAVRLIWGSTDALGERFPRDVELAVLWRLPVAIIELPNLSGARVVEWLAARGITLPVHTPPGGLRGALVAFAGSGVLFVDATDAPAERRVSLAHEAAHFAVDYWLPRLELAERAPHLLAVVDGLRPANDDDHVDALIARAPLGVQTHLFERDSSGAMLTPEVKKLEQRAAQVAWEVLAPQAAVTQHLSGPDPFALVRTLEVNFGLPRATARDYAQHLRRALSPRKGHRRFDWR
jgi:hypothetical protein